MVNYRYYNFIIINTVIQIRRIINIRVFCVFKRFIFINFIKFGFNVFLRRTYLYSQFIILF